MGQPELGERNYKVASKCFAKQACKINGSARDSEEKVARILRDLTNRREIPDKNKDTKNNKKSAKRAKVFL